MIISSLTLITSIAASSLHLLTKDNNDSSNIPDLKKNQFKKIFISHSTKDKEIVEEFVDLVEHLGLRKENIFCTSFDEYSIELGENFLDRIKKELKNNPLVIFMFSDNFFKSEICLCEMGATWALSHTYIPILIPPFDFKDIKGVLPNTQGFIITNKEKFNSFKIFIEEHFDIKNSLDHTSWERKRDRAIDNIKKAGRKKIR